MGPTIPGRLVPIWQVYASTSPSSCKNRTMLVYMQCTPMWRPYVHTQYYVHHLWRIYLKVYSGKVDIAGPIYAWHSGAEPWRLGVNRLGQLVLSNKSAWLCSPPAQLVSRLEVSLVFCLHWLLECMLYECILYSPAKLFVIIYMRSSDRWGNL